MKSMIILLYLIFLTSDLVFPKSISRLVPTNRELILWRKNESGKIYKENRLYEYINGGADIFLEYGFRQVITQEYMRGDETIVIDIYEMTDPEAAFGIYSITRDYKKPALNVGDDGTQFDFQVVFWQSRYYVIVMGDQSDRETKKILCEFAQIVSYRIGKNSQSPQFLSYLPPQGLLPRSKGYIKGVLGLNSQLYLGNDIFKVNGFRVEGAFGTYKDKDDEAQLILIRYPNQREAEEKKRLVLGIFSNQYEKFSRKDDMLFKDRKARLCTVSAARNFLYIIFKSSSKGMIHKILRRLP